MCCPEAAFCAAEEPLRGFFIDRNKDWGEAQQYLVVNEFKI
jgi:hypothetical protein